MFVVGFSLAGAVCAAGPEAKPPASESAPGKAAVSWLETLRKGKKKSEWLGLTGISRFTSKNKRKELARRIEALASAIDDKLPLVVETTKVSQNLAGVVVSQYSQMDAAGPHLFGVALVFRDGHWLPTPSPGTFENTLYGYDSVQTRRAREIEMWLLHERATRGAEIQERAMKALHKRMLASVSLKEVKDISPKKFVRRFLDACSQRDVDTVLALLGGIQDPLPSDWSARHAAVLKAFDDKRESLDRPWRLLAAPSVARAIVGIEYKTRRSTVVVLGCLDPMATDNSGISTESPAPPLAVSVTLTRSPNGLWRIDLPKFLVNGPQKHMRSFESDWLETLIDKTDPDLIEHFPEMFQKEHPPQKLADPAALASRFVKALNSGDFPGMLRLAAPAKDPLVSLTGYDRLSTIWRSLHGEGTLGTAVLLGTLKAPETTAVAIHLFTAQKPEAAQVVVVRTLRNPDGTWSLAPRVQDLVTKTPPPWKHENPTDDEKQSKKKESAPADPLKKRIAVAMPKWKAKTGAATIAAAERLDVLPSTPPPTPEQAASAVLEWREALLDGDVPAALRNAAVFNFKKSASRFLRALAHEWIGIDRSGNVGKVVASGSLGHWAAVTLRVEGPDGPTYPFYVVVSGKGPAKVVPEIDLFQNGNRTRRFLNKTTWRQLREEWPWPRETLDELEKLFEQQKDSLAKPSPDDPRKS